MRPDYVVKREHFPFLAIELVVEGFGSLVLNGKRHSLSPGTVFAYGPRIPHTIQTEARRPMRKYYVDFAGLEAEQLLKLTALGGWKAASIAAAHEVVEIFESLAKEARDDNPAAQEICSALLRLLLIKIRQRALPVSRSLPRSFSTYEKLRRHVENHFLRIHSVDELAKECHVSPMYISRLFKRFGQTGAYQFLLRLKMNRAAELLLEEGLLVKEAASALGFPDPFQFSRAFKRVHGVAPMTLLNSRRS
jgi:AraC-like DNA-binding protein